MRLNNTPYKISGSQSPWLLQSLYSGSQSPWAAPVPGFWHLFLSAIFQNPGNPGYGFPCTSPRRRNRCLQSACHAISTTIASSKYCILFHLLPKSEDRYLGTEIASIFHLLWRHSHTDSSDSQNQRLCLRFLYRMNGLVSTQCKLHQLIYSF